MTYEEFIHRICELPTWSWSAAWWRLSEIIVAVPEDSPSRIRDRNGKLMAAWSTRKSDAVCPPDVLHLGCTGADCQGRLAWCAWDLDVHHGKQSYGQSHQDRLYEPDESKFRVAESFKFHPYAGQHHGQNTASPKERFE